MSFSKWQHGCNVSLLVGELLHSRSPGYDAFSTNECIALGTLLAVRGVPNTEDILACLYNTIRAIGGLGQSGRCVQ